MILVIWFGLGEFMNSCRHMDPLAFENQTKRFDLKLFCKIHPLISGGVFYLNESGKCVQVFNSDGPVHKLLYYEDKNILVTITTSLMLSQHSVSTEGDCREILKVLQYSSKAVSGRMLHF